MHSIFNDLNIQSNSGIVYSDKLNEQTIALVSDAKNDKNAGFINLSERSRKHNVKLDDTLYGLTPFPRLGERFVFFTYGPSGRGKTLLNVSICFHYQRVTKLPIYYFTSKEVDIREDKTFRPYLNAGLKIKVVDMNEKFYQNVKYTDYANSICLFDDNDNAHNKTKLFKLINTVAEVGRSHNISLMVITHTASIGNIARGYMSDIQYIITFYDSLKLDQNGKTHNRLFTEYFPNLNLGSITNFSKSNFLFISIYDKFIISNDMIMKI